jgi:alpha-ketoglutarate-dependent taurine dioxygenase
VGILVRKLHPLFAAEVVGVDLTRPLDDATFAELRDAFFAHAVVPVRDQALTDARQLAYVLDAADERLHPLHAREVPPAGGALAVSRRRATRP